MTTMRYLNDYDLTMAVTRFTRATKPNRLALALVVSRLAEWADDNSDGWAYWPKPARAASVAMSHIESTTYTEDEAQERDDITDAELRHALRPIKAFLTRHKVPTEDRELIFRAVEGV